MPNQDQHQPHYPTVERVIDSIADWVNRYRAGSGERNELGQCGTDDVKTIAKDLGISVNELRNIASKGPGGADSLARLLAALHVDLERIRHSEPAVMRDLQRICAHCGNKTRCAHELADGTAAEHFHEFCPNAYTLDALLPRKAEKA